LFKIKEHGSTVRTEIIGGLTTFFTMAYIIFVNSGLLSQTGMDATGVAVATCLSAALGSLLTGLMSNTPFAQASGMGLNAFFVFTVATAGKGFGMGYTWQQALTIVLLDGVVFLAVAVSPLRTKIISAIPACLKSAIGAGIGLFIAFIGLVDGGMISFGAGVPAFNDFTHGAALLFVIGLVVLIILMVLKVRGAIFLGIVITAVIGLVPTLCGSTVFGTFQSAGASAYSLSSIGKIGLVAFKFDFPGLMSNGILALITAVFSFALVDCFDTIGTLIGTAANAGMLDKDGNLPGGDKALVADAIATCTGACLGTSTVTTFVESASGIAEGARTGLSSIVVAGMFILSLLITPFFDFLGANVWFLYAISCPALVVVGVLMIKSVVKIHWDDIEEAIPCFLTIAVMPFAYSISEGIGFGFISYCIVKLVRGKGKEVSGLLYVISAIFVLKYILANL